MFYPTQTTAAILSEQDSVALTVADPTYLPTVEVAGVATALARLRGVGLYYTDNRCDEICKMVSVVTPRCAVHAGAS